VMQEVGVLPIVLGGIGYLAAFARAVAFGAAAGLAPSVPLRFAALACRIEEDVERLTGRLRLSNAERDAMLAALAAAAAIVPKASVRDDRRALYRHGAQAYRDGMALAFACGDAAPDDQAWVDRARLPERWSPPAFPLTGRDVVGAGGASGPAVGMLLKAVEAWWIDHDFAADEVALRRRLQQMVAETQ